MGIDFDQIETCVKRHGRVARILIASTAGSTPRNAGTSMLVWQSGSFGTIGGGALEYDAISSAQESLSIGEAKPPIKRMSLGPRLGQCCGGSLTLIFEIFDQEKLATARRISGDSGLYVRAASASLTEKSTRVASLVKEFESNRSSENAVIVDGWVVERSSNKSIDVWVFGAGHVGRAIVRMISDARGFGITWVDFEEDRFPDDINNRVNKLVAVDPASAAVYSPKQAHHIVLTHSHDLDLNICNSLLARDVTNIQLIGSKTKWRRFRKRFLELGHTSELVDRIVCPIGNPELGKDPWSIALGVCHQLKLSAVTNSE